MSKHYGDPVEEPPRVPPRMVDRNRLLKFGIGITLTVVAWGYLVFAAIDFGGQGREGDGSAWVFLAFATVGATACMFAMLILAHKVLVTLHGDGPPPRVPGGGKRARR